MDRVFSFLSHLIPHSQLRRDDVDTRGIHQTSKQHWCGYHHAIGRCGWNYHHGPRAICGGGSPLGALVGSLHRRTCSSKGSHAFRISLHCLFSQQEQNLFAIIQGGLDVSPGGLRDICLTEMIKRDTPGTVSSLTCDRVL